MDIFGNHYSVYSPYQEEFSSLLKNLALFAYKIKSGSSTWHFQALHDCTPSCFSRFISYELLTLHCPSHGLTEPQPSSNTFLTVLCVLFMLLPLPGILSSFSIFISQELIQILPLPKYAFILSLCPHAELIYTQIYTHPPRASFEPLIYFTLTFIRKTFLCVFSPTRLEVPI